MTDQAGAAGATNSNTSGADAGAAAAGNVSGQPPAANAGAASPIAWLPDANEEMVGYIQNKGFDSPGKVVESYRHLEKVLGADRAGRTVVVPGDGSDAKEWGVLYDKLGRPSEPSKYEIPVPEGHSPEFANEASTWFHEAGLSKKQANALAEKWNGYVTAQAQKMNETAAAEVQKQAGELKSEWGQAYEQNMRLAQQTRATLKVSDEEVDKISGVLGLKRTIQMFHELGSRTGEPDFATGKPGGSNVLTPGQAQARINELKSDPGFRARYAAGNVEAKNEMARLHQFAYPEEKK